MCRENYLHSVYSFTVAVCVCVCVCVLLKFLLKNIWSKIYEKDFSLAPITIRTSNADYFNADYLDADYVDAFTTTPTGTGEIIATRRNISPMPEL